MGRLFFPQLRGFPNSNYHTLVMEVFALLMYNKGFKNKIVAMGSFI